MASKPRRRRLRQLPPVSVLPTLFTLGNLVAGFAAIHIASRPAEYTGPWGWSGLTLAAVLVFLGMLLDGLDGSVARLTGSISELGGYLDSLADVVTFGLAPAFMTAKLVERYLSEAPATFIIGPEADDFLGKAVWAVAVVYLCCAALRLARFNVETAPERIEHGKSFRGLPSPGAAGTVTSLILLHQHLEYLLVERFADEVPMAFIRGAALGMPFITLLCGFAMVSSIPYAHVANRYLYGPRSFAYVARLVVLLALVIWFTPYMAAVLFTAYVLSGPLQLIRERRRAAVGPSPNGNDEATS